MKKIIVILGLFFVISCHQQPFSHIYLLQHPDKLAQEVQRCYTTVHPDEEYCLMVKRTEEDFIGLANVRLANFEQFGQQILESQQQLAILAEKLKKANPKELQAAQAAYDEQLQKVRMLLAVVKATTQGP